MTQINFKGTFCIPASRSFSQNRDKIYQKREKYNMLIESINYRDTINESYITVPDEMDGKVSKLLNKYLISYYYFNMMDRVNKQEVFNRIKIDDADKALGYEVVEINVDMLDRFLKRQPKYVGYKASGDGSYDKYCRFMRFLHTKNDIKPPSLGIIKHPDGDIALQINDGRHRFAVLRDIGMEKIPVMIDRESMKIGKEIGIL